MNKDTHFSIVASDRTKAGFDSARRNIQSIDAGLKTVTATARSFAAAFGIGFVAGGLAQLPGVFRDVVRESSALAKTADLVGLTTDELQRLQFGAGLAGVETDALNKALEQLGKRSVEAATRGGVLADIFKANGVSLRDSNGQMRSQMDLLSELADLIKNASSESERLAIANEAFGRSGASMVLALRNGASGIRDLMAAANDAGGVIDEQLLRRAEEIDDAWEIVERRFKVGFKTAIIESIDVLSKFASEWDTLGTSVDRFISSPSARNFGLMMLGGDLTPQETLGDKLRAPGNQSGSIFTLGDILRDKTTVPTRPGSGKSDEEKRAEAITKVVEALKFEAEQLGRTNTEQRVYNELRAAGVDLNSEAGQQIATLVTRIEGERAAMEALKKQQEASKKAWEYLGETAADALGLLISNSEDAEDALKRLAIQLAYAVLQAKLLGEGPLAGLFGGGGGGGGIGGLLGGIVKGLFGGFRAGGGPVSAGRAYVVGERGPEMFVPNSSGSIVANGAMGGAVVNITNQFVGPITAEMKSYFDAQIRQSQQAAVAQAVSGVRAARYNRPGFFGG